MKLHGETPLNMIWKTELSGEEAQDVPTRPASRAVAGVLNSFTYWSASSSAARCQGAAGLPAVRLRAKRVRTGPAMASAKT